MGAIAVYIIKSALLLTAMFLAYKLTAGRLKCASLRRSVLLAIYVLCLVGPVAADLLPMAVAKVGSDTVAVVGTGTFAKGTIETHIWINVLLVVMGVGASIVALMTIAGLLWIAKCWICGRNILVGNLRVTVVSSPEISPFSFGGHIFLSETDFEAYNEMVIAHESSHVRHCHYLDLLLGRVVSITQWWNPFAWMMLRELQSVHEYQADEDVIAQGFSAYDYQYLLLEKTVGSKFQLMADCLNHTPLKARLKMINRKESAMPSRLLIALCVPAMIVGLMAVSSKSFAAYMQPVANAFDTAKREVIVIRSADFNKKSKEKDAQPSPNPDVMINGKIVEYNSLNSLNPQKIKDITVAKDNDEHPNGLLIINLK